MVKKSRRKKYRIPGPREAGNGQAVVKKWASPEYVTMMTWTVLVPVSSRYRLLKAGGIH